MGFFDFLKLKKTSNDRNIERPEVSSKDLNSHNDSEEVTEIINEVSEELNKAIEKLSEVTNEMSQVIENLSIDVNIENDDFDPRPIEFEKRKKTAIPSQRGLYPAEILLLDYCSKGSFPNPKFGYQQFWWYQYGLDDVDKYLKKLEDRGFITLASIQESLKNLIIKELKQILRSQKLPVSGRKAELIKRISENVPEEVLLTFDIPRKYKLTELGQLELEENAYVPYMHRNSNTTTESSNLENDFNVWSINILLGSGEKSNWKSIVDEQEEKRLKRSFDNYNSFKKDLKEIDSEGYNELILQDQQIDEINKAAQRYSENNDIEAYIAFWEDMWANGLLIEGLGINFKLADLYIQAKRYDDALDFVKKIKREKSDYCLDKANEYIEKIEAIKAEQKYKEDQDLEAYITFWENIWANGGLKSEGIGIHFKLADLYIKAKRYDDALDFVKRIKREKSEYYYNKADKYIKRLEKLKAKQKLKNKKQ